MSQISQVAPPLERSSCVLAWISLRMRNRRGESGPLEAELADVNRAAKRLGKKEAARYSAYARVWLIEGVRLNPILTIYVSADCKRKPAVAYLRRIDRQPRWALKSEAELTIRGDVLSRWHPPARIACGSRQSRRQPSAESSNELCGSGALLLGPHSKTAKALRQRHRSC